MYLSDKQLELYGVKTYQYYLNLAKYRIIEFESPDFILWQKHNSTTGKIGFEFSKPSTGTQNIGNHLVNKYFSKGMSSLEIIDSLTKKEREFLKHGEICNVEGINSISSSKGLVDTSSCHIRICKSIEQKTEKLNKGYTLLHQNVLYLLPYSTFMSEDSDFQHIKEFLDSLIHCFKMTYDQIIIDAISELIIYEKREAEYFYRIIIMDLDMNQKIQESCL